jgi:bifunctional enzyme CysN/CysC
MADSSRAAASSPALVRVVICGAVDDGKSTLLGRLLFETGSVSSDELEAARRSSLTSNALMGAEKLDFSLLVDGLESEREQGITIDIAHRQLRLTSGTRVLLADSPGHEQYTRNMAVASSTADIAVLVVDAVRGIRKQTLRHAAVCRLMGVRQLIVAINKLDATPRPAETMSAIRESLLESFAQAQWASGDHDAGEQFSFIGVSGLRGDNVTIASEQLPSGSQPTLLALLEATCDAVGQPDNGNRNATGTGTSTGTGTGTLRLPVQAVLRHDTHRRYAGRLRGEELSVGDSLAVWPSGATARVIALHSPNKCTTAPIGSSVSVELDTELDIGRGDILVRADDLASLPESRAHLAEMVWMDPAPLDPLKCQHASNPFGSYSTSTPVNNSPGERSK